MYKGKIEGVGLSLRFPHFDDILTSGHSVPWFEIIADDFLVKGPHWNKLLKLREEKPIAMHSIGMNIGGVDKLNLTYLNKLKEIYSIYEPEWISDHLCWSAHGGKFHHDLLPIPRTKEGLDHVVDRINYLQDFFTRPLVLENITQYIDYKNTDFSEVEFINEIVGRTDCELLLDISNMLINHKNRNLDYMDFLQEYPLTKVKQFHLAGGVLNDDFWIDTHTESVGREDVEILKKIIKMGHNIPGVIERDGNLPSFSEFNNQRLEISGVV